MEWKVGDAVLYYDRVAEVLSTTSAAGPGVVEVTDAGGLVWNYTVRSPTHINPLQEPGELILDAIVRITSLELRPYQQACRIAEQWLAAPAAGDVFAIITGYYLELTEIWDTGVIIGINHMPALGKSWQKQEPVSFTDARALRQFLMDWRRPVYRAAAHSSLRKAFEGHAALYKHPGSSPLFTA
jgi:hypothetical protein